MAKHMTSRERFRATFHYGQPDRVWLYPQWTFPETLERWLREGMPRDQHFNSYWGYDRIEYIPLRMGPWPPLEEKVVESGPGWHILQDEFGGQTKVWTGDTSGMPQWLLYPIRDRAGWEKFKERLDPEALVRYPEYWDDYKRSLHHRSYPLVLSIGSYYGWIRNWVGAEHLALWYYEQPDLVREMTEYVADFVLRVIERALAEIPNIDCAAIWEDMGMKTGPLVGPQLFREFMLEPMKRVTKVVNEAGINLISVDSDGNNDVLVPLWLEANVNFLYPLEIAADTDPVALRREHGKELRLAGGIDKRVLREGCTKQDIEREVMSKVPRLVKDGGFSPWVDHAVPPDVPFQNFRYYMDLIHEVCTVA